MQAAPMFDIVIQNAHPPLVLRNNDVRQACDVIKEQQSKMAGSYNRATERRSNNPFDDENDDELDEYEFDHAISKLEQTQNRIIGSTSRSLGLIEESHNIAIKTAEELDRQEEVLRRTDGHLDEMRQNMTTANRHIKSVRSIWGAIGNYFSKPANTTSTGEKKQEESCSSVPAPQKPLKIESDLQLDYGQENYLSEYGGRKSTSDRTTSDSAFERRYNNHLAEISRGLGVLKDDALVLGDTIDRHDEIINRVQGKIDVVDDEVRDADRKVRRILRR